MKRIKKKRKMTKKKRKMTKKKKKMKRKKKEGGEANHRRKKKANKTVKINVLAKMTQKTVSSVFGGVVRGRFGFSK